MEDVRGLLNRGNWHRLKKCMKKAKQGKKIMTSFLGGSITQGSLSSSLELCYAYLVFEWWKKKFPQSEIKLINAGIGGTTSQFGAARVKEHLLKYNPDFILIEFAVNDENSEFFEETYEGLIRKTYGDVCAPAILLMNNVRYDDGTNAEERHVKVARAYDLPMVSMKSAIWPDIESGRISGSSISPDGLHPNDRGHALVAGAVIAFLEKVFLEMDKEEAPACFEAGALPVPITANAYENAIRYQNDNFTPQLNGFEADLSPQNGIADIFKKGWCAFREGDKVRFEVDGTEIAVQYRKSVHKPAPVAKAVVDGKEDDAVILDGNFEEDWGDCLYIDTVGRHMETGKHTVELAIIKAHEDDAVPFYLVSVIVSGPCGLQQDANFLLQ
ncbi:SGNH/GDSL hydrolase family protein [Parablautia muri]